MISICIPYVRPKLIPPLIKKIKSRSGFTPSDLEILAEEDVAQIGCPKMLKKLVDKASGQYICFLGDDTDPQENFLRNAIGCMKTRFSGKGLIGFNDNTGRDLPIHWVAHRSLLDKLDGEFFHTCYHHTFCDVELMVRCKQMDLYYHSIFSKVLHNHPAFNSKIKIDEHYIRAYSNQKADKALFYQRKKNGWVTNGKG